MREYLFRHAKLSHTLEVPHVKDQTGPCCQEAAPSPVKLDRKSRVFIPARFFFSQKSLLCLCLCFYFSKKWSKSQRAEGSIGGARLEWMTGGWLWNPRACVCVCQIILFHLLLAFLALIYGTVPQMEWNVPPGVLVWSTVSCLQRWNCQWSSCTHAGFLPPNSPP